MICCPLGEADECAKVYNVEERRARKEHACCECREPIGVGACHYVIVRADLPHGSQVAQTIHAAGESTPVRVVQNTVAVALHARDQPHLAELAQALVAAGIPHRVIAECDGELMAIGIEPSMDRPRIRKVVSQLPMVR